MKEDNITCPHCGHEIELKSAIKKQVEEAIRKDFEAVAKKKDEEFRRREGELAAEKKRLEDAREDIGQIVNKKLAAEKLRIKEESLLKAREEAHLELKDLREENSEKEKRLEEARRNEIEIRKKARALEDREREIELKAARQLDSERELIRREAAEKSAEEHRLKDLEKDKQLNDMRRALEEAKRKGEQGSMQTQGEVVELDLEEMLALKFPTDDIRPVPKGFRGADIIQTVRGRNGEEAGSIIWEIKNTKAWGGDWITKLKDDQREARADIAIIVSKALPEGIDGFGAVSGVWVTGIQLAQALAVPLRSTLLELANARTAATGKGEKMEVLYSYMSGPEFKQKIESIVETFVNLKEELEKEKTAYGRIWARREKQLERVIKNTGALYGDMQGIIGATLPEIKTLELDSGDDEPGQEKLELDM